MFKCSGESHALRSTFESAISGWYNILFAPVPRVATGKTKLCCHPWLCYQPLNCHSPLTCAWWRLGRPRGPAGWAADQPEIPPPPPGSCSWWGSWRGRRCASPPHTLATRPGGPRTRSGPPCDCRGASRSVLICRKSVLVNLHLEQFSYQPAWVIVDLEWPFADLKRASMLKGGWKKPPVMAAQWGGGVMWLLGLTSFFKILRPLHCW